jgi:hypothetical protein
VKRRDFLKAASLSTGALTHALTAGGGEEIQPARPPAVRISSVSYAPGDYPIQPVRFSRVALTDAFWKPKIATNAAVTIPLLAARDEGRGLNGNVLEAAILSLETHPNPALQASVEG